MRRTKNEVEEAIAAAVRDELAEHGYAKVSFEGVARRANTSKPVLYRRYSSRAEMVLTSLGRSLWFEVPTGLSQLPLRQGILALLRYARNRSEVVGADTLRALIGEADKTILALLTRAMEKAEGILAEQVIAPAVDRGELGPEPIASGVLCVPFAVLREQFLFRTNVPMTLEEIADNICLPLLKAATQPQGASGGQV